jgi:hypothetical protein
MKFDLLYAMRVDQRKDHPFSDAAKAFPVIDKMARVMRSIELFGTKIIPCLS